MMLSFYKRLRKDGRLPYRFSLVEIHSPLPGIYSFPLAFLPEFTGRTRHKSLPCKGNFKTRFFHAICEPWGTGGFGKIGADEFLKPS